MPSVIKIPQELARELDRLAEAEHKPRAAFVVELLRNDIRRAKQREALRLSAGAWNSADHPELIKGGAARVEQIRSESDRRFGDAIRRQKT
jgi:metal-responsive CopG/Arc/MetJ family transcriptional regulator